MSRNERGGILIIRHIKHNYIIQCKSQKNKSKFIRVHLRELTVDKISDYSLNEDTKKPKSSIMHNTPIKNKNDRNIEQKAKRSA